MTCAHPLELGRLADYFASDLDVATATEVEDHLFTCATCTAMASDVEAVTTGIARLIPPVVSAARIARLRAGGAKIRENAFDPGADARVVFDSNLDLLVHVLRADLAGVERVDIEIEDGGPEPKLLEAIPFDPAAGTVLIACQRHFRDLGAPDDIRFRVVAVAPQRREVRGEYTIRHVWVDRA